jgi:sterol 3beta-glucosyltransferase
MRILILTVGTRGDVQPYVALGKGLVQAGHDTTICTCARFEDFVTAHGIRYACMNNDLIEFMGTDDGQIAMEDTTNVLQAIRTGIKLFPKIREMMSRQVDQMWAACEATRPDLILFHKKAIGAEDFAEKLGVPCALAFYLPLSVPTSEFPAMGFPPWNLGSAYNRFTYRLVDWATRMSSGKFVKPWRERHGLASRRDRSRDSASDSLPALHAYSPSVIPQPSDWPETSITTGYWFLDDPDPSWSPPDRLVEFLARGPAPIYVGFGSIYGRDPRRTATTVVEAIKRVGTRAIIASGWGGLNVDPADLDSDILQLDAAPHDWLFPRVTSVVHHGGCGTTAAALRAGKPSVVCPFFGDQPFWGSKVRQLGTGPKPIPQKKLSRDNLANAIEQTLEDQPMRRRAEKLGMQIRAEDGVATAVEFIEQRFARR